MSRSLVILAWTLGAVVVLVSTVVVRTMSSAGQFTTIKPIGTQNCRAVAAIVGSEDIVIDRTAGVAYISSTDRRAIATGRGAGVRGEIFALNLEDPEASPKPLSAGSPREFRPHGLSLFRNEAGSKLFAVNQRADGRQTIERWTVEPDGLKHLPPELESPLFGSPNDIVAVGPDQFYVTNDGGGSGITRAADFILQRGRGSVVYYDGEAARVVADGFGYANGIAVSADGKTVYVADMFKRTLEIFDRDKTSGALKHTGSVFFGTGLDNIDIDPDDAVWIGSHPKLIDLARYMNGSLDISPSQIIRAVPTTDGERAARTVMLDLGTTVPAASVAVRYGDRFLVGSVAGPNVMACDFKPAEG